MAIPTDGQNIQSIVSSLSATQIAIVASAAGAVVAALVSGVFFLLNTWIVKRAENQRAMRELVMKYAMR